MIGDVDANAMEAVAADLNAEGIAHRVERCDVTSTESLQGLLDAALETFGQVDLAFANAGIGAGEAGTPGAIPRRTGSGALTSIGACKFDQCLHALPHYPARSYPAMIITGSGNGAYTVLPDVPIYLQ